MNAVFYELITTSIEKALPKLVEKIYEQKLNCHIYCSTQDVLSLLNDSLWTYAQLGFLPHGTSADPKETHSENPIWLSLDLSYVNNPQVLVSLKPEKIDFQGKLIYLYDKENEGTSFEKLQTNNSTIWYQDLTGTWKKRD